MNSILITVRTGSTRLPKKALIEINGKPTIEYLIERVKQSKFADNIILCTTKLPEDDILCKLAQKNNIKYYRGSIEDKLNRWLGACNQFNIDFFVTADGDDLFCEHTLIDLAFSQYKKYNPDFIKAPGVVCGAFTYGIKKSALEKVCQIKDSKNTEMHWVYFEETGLFNVHHLENIPIEYIRSDIRMTLDYPDDLKFFTNIINHFGTKQFGLTEIIHYINNNSDVSKINLYLEKQWSANQQNKIDLKIKANNE